MFESKIIDIENTKEWNKLLSKIKDKDVYFTPEYLKIYNDNYNKHIDENFCGKPILLFFGNKNEFILLSLIKREINLNGKKYYDLISPYGYSGPLSKFGKNKEKLLEYFKLEYSSLCKKKRIVTSFIRFHPLIENHKIYSRLYKLKKQNKTVYVDLTQEHILMELNKKTRNLIRKAIKKNVKIRFSKDKKDLKNFTKLYLSTMKKNKANLKYLFPIKFFENHLKFLKNKISIIIAEHNGQMISAALFIQMDKFINYHFAGSDKTYLNLSPNNLIIWEAIKMGKKNKNKFLHLGGGLNDGDSLFKFKKSFSKLRRRLYTANIIHDNKTYKRLCALRDSVDGNNKSKVNDNFFPYYRR